MKNNIDEAFPSWGSARRRPKNPGEGSELPKQRKKPPVVSPPPGRFTSGTANRDGTSVVRTDVPKERIKSSPKGNITYISRQKTETEQTPNPPTPRFTKKQLTIIRSLSARQRKKLGIPDIHTGGPIKLTTNTGRPLKPGGKAANERIGAARSAGSQTRIARRERTQIIKEFIEKYRKSILK